MRRYWVDAKSVSGDSVSFSGDVFHHIFDVCRQDKGSKFEVLDGSGLALLVEVSDVQKNSARARVLEKRSLPKALSPKIILALSIPRFPVFDSVIEKCVELGVAEVFPFFSEYSFVRTADKVSESRTERWNKIVVSATQQSGRGDLMKIHQPVLLAQVQSAFNRTTRPWGLIAYEGQIPVSIAEELENKPAQSVDEVWIFVGGEGGFSEREVQQIAGWGIKPVTLGDQVLRVETACITLVSILKYGIGHFRRPS